jgi:steroid delta-isomerase-like uncharacterized protein
MSTDPTTLGRRFFEELLGQAKWSVADELLAPDIVMHHPSSPAPVAGSEAVQGFLGAFRGGFPDMNMAVEDVFGSGDRAAVRWRMRGTHTASLFGIPPTGKQVNVAGISILRVAGGKIVEDWVSEDTMGLMQQLGLVPANG